MNKRAPRIVFYRFPWNQPADIQYDGILGTGITSPPRGIVRDAIAALNVSSGRVLSIDVPSGLNHVTGETPGVCVAADYTLNLHMFKSGQLEEKAAPYIGELWSAETALGFTTFGDAR